MTFEASNYPSTSLAGKIVRFPLRLLPKDKHVPILQGRLKGKKWILGSSDHGCWLGIYEQKKRTLFEKTVTENNVVYDVGAHVGFYTLLASDLVGPVGKVFAFEPVPENLSCLREHIRINGVHNVSVFESAVAERSGWEYFERGTSSSTGRIYANGSLRVRAVSLDALRAQSGISGPDVIKIDVEGAEYRVLCGARDLIGKFLPTIFLATHGPTVHERCCELLVSWGYQLQPIGKKDLRNSDEILAMHGVNP
jgi:FkbM family methyltransferase